MTTRPRWRDMTPGTCWRCGIAVPPDHRICGSCIARESRRFVAARGDIQRAWPDLPIRTASALARAVDSAAAARALTDEAFLALDALGPTSLAAFRALVPAVERSAARDDWRTHADMLAGVAS